MRRYRSRTLLTSILAGGLLVACGDDSSSGGSIPDDESSSGGAASGAVNGDLPGRLLLTSEYVLDPDTGRTRPFIRSTSIGEGRLALLSPNPDATRFYAVEKDCDRDDFYFLDTDCIVVFDAAGDELSRLNVGRPIFGYAQESFDGTMIAFVVYDRDYDSRSLTITDREGNVLSEGLYEGGEFIRSGVTYVRWLPDGDLVYGDIGSNRLYRVVNPPAARPEDDRIIFDPDQTNMRGGEGATGLDGFDVNPSNGEIAFVWNAGPNSVSRDDTLYRMNVDGSGLRPFARSSAIKNLDGPKWSFDGEWVALLAGGSAVAGNSRDLALVALRTGVTEEHVIDDSLRERIDSEDIVFIDSDCQRFVGCGYDTVQPTSNEAVTGWFR